MFNNICKSNANQSFSPTTTNNTNTAIATVTTTNNFNHNNKNFINGYKNNLNGNGNKSDDDDRSGMNQNNNNKNSSSSSPTPQPSELPSNKFASNKVTSYYHTFNCSRDMKKRKTVHNFLHRDMTNNTINELRNNFERIFSNGGNNNHEHTTTSSTTITNNNHNKNHKTRQFSNRQDILMNTDRQKKFPLTCYGDDLSNIDVKSLVSTSLVCY